MIGVAVAVAALAGAFYVAFRTMPPFGVGVSPWPYLIGVDPHDGFVRDLPQPGDDLCGAHPTQEAIDNAGRWANVRALTTCVIPHPGHAKPYGAHMALLVTDDSIRPGQPLLTNFTWLEPPPAGKPPRVRRWTWWRRLVVRLAAP